MSADDRPGDGRQEWPGDEDRPPEGTGDEDRPRPPEDTGGEDRPHEEGAGEDAPAEADAEWAVPDPAPDPDDAGFDTEESSGLGLTDEFARIEAEIEADTTPPAERSDGEGEEAAPTTDDWAPPGQEGVRAEPPAASGEDTSAPAESGTEAGPDAGTEPPEPEPEPEPQAGTEPPEPEPDAGTEPSEPAAEGPDPVAGAPATGEEPPEPADAAPAGGPVAGDGDEGTGERPGEEDTVVQRPDDSRPIVRPMPRPGVPVGAGAAFTDEELSAGSPKLWLRFLAGSVMIIASVAAAVSVTGLLFLSDVAAKLQPIPGVGEQLEQVDPGAPQTILIIGSDRRAGDDPDLGARSDTTMLLRVDPEKEVLSLFSLPRDLKVDIPGVGVGKLNEAYTAGGEKKTLKTVKAFTGIEINHVVEINFDGFADAVDAIDCVYIDVDREYFNDNSGVAAGTLDGYAEIDINAGYQRLCGLKALQYVRFRHADNDLVRAARQQDFLREARQKVEPKELLGAVVGVGTGNELINIFTEYTRSDIDDEDDVIGILKSFAAMQNVPVNEVHFEGDIGDANSTFVTSSDEQVQTAIDQFLNGVGSEGQRGGKKASEKKGNGGKEKEKEKDPIDGAAVVPTDSLADQKFPTLAERFAADGAKNARRLEIPVFYPTEVVPASAFGTDSRTYEYKNEEDRKESAYKTVIEWTQPSGLVEYYGVMGTTWTDPPILREPSEVRKIGGREFLLFYDGGRLRQVGWREKGNSYWLNNTLTQSIGEAEMLAIASTMREV